ncbi:hypothetical protein SteCoe_13922 [Stentor coeruleus]|uniref:CD36 family protein n=1 Tax=Stentor coeruleus TaxID=5963 RepID=A0A1R2C7F2_9CILI|nr:hypothetical protein SteCoe_13922 [Stentor coeruleus]
MAVKPWLIGGSLICFGLIFIIMGALTPMIVDSSLKTQAKDKAILKSSNHKSFWGEIPGDTEQVIFTTFNFFHIENPNQILWQGATPILTEKNGYIYQEFDDFVDYNFDGDYLEYFNYKRLLRTNKCIWGNSTKPTDHVTTVNLGSMMAWTTQKHLPREKLAVYTMYQLYYIMTYELSQYIFTAYLYNQINTLELAEEIIFANTGLTPENMKLIYSDPYYGLNSTNTFTTWVIVLLENVYSNNFSPPANYSGALFDLVNYFSFTPSQVNAMFSGKFLNNFLVLMGELYNFYACTGTFNGMKMCNPEYIGALQWSEMAVTQFPYSPSLPASLTISSFFPYLTGFPEIRYYLFETTIGQKYPGVQLNATDFYRLFNFNKTTGWPIYDPSSLMDIGRMSDFFTLAYSGNFNEMTSVFGFQDVNHTKVFWDYVNSLVDLTAFQGRYDPLVYDKLGRGLSSEYSLGYIGSQTLQEVLDIFANQMPLQLTSIYGYLQAEYHINVTCDGLVQEVLPGSSICEIPELMWQNDTTGYSYWVAVNWYGIDSYYGQFFQNVSGLSSSEMNELFNPTTNLSKVLTQFDLELKELYNCNNYGNRCSGRYLAEIQWQSSYISLHWPSNFKLFNIKSSNTLYGVDYFNLPFKGPSEYYWYALNNNTSTLTVEQTRFLLSNQGLYVPQMMQLFFIYLYENNNTAIELNFTVTEPYVLGTYLRHMINSYYFNGIFMSKTVDELLFTYEDPLIAESIIGNPLQGGNPALNLESALFGRNQTREQLEYIPKSYISSINSGKSSSEKTRKYKKYLGANYNSILRQQYYGQGPEGPNLNYSNFNPWGQKIPISGTDGLGFHPDIDKNSDLSFYFEPGALSIPLDYKETKTHSGLECYRFDYSNSIFDNITSNPSKSVYYQYAPKGLLNLTNIFNAPIFLSRPYFLNGDSVLNNLISYTTSQFNIPSNYHTSIDIEKYTGNILYQKQQLQYNLELKPDALFPMLSQVGLNNNGYYTFLPVFMTIRSALITDSNNEDNFGYITSALIAADIIVFVGVFLGCLMVIAAGLYALKLRINKKRLERSQRTDQNRQPILLA